MSDEPKNLIEHYGRTTESPFLTFELIDGRKRLYAIVQQDGTVVTHMNPAQLASAYCGLLNRMFEFPVGHRFLSAERLIRRSLVMESTLASVDERIADATKELRDKVRGLDVLARNARGEASQLAADNNVLRQKLAEKDATIAAMQSGWGRPNTEAEALVAAVRELVSPPKPLERDPRLAENINDALPLSVRIKNALFNDQIYTIGDLVTKSESELLKIPNFGRKSLKELVSDLHAYGFQLGSAEPLDSVK